MTVSEKHIAVVCNPTPGHEKARREADNIVLLLHGMGVRHSLFDTTWPTDFEAFSEVWIAGGDGTLNWFINQYPDIQRPLSIFAGGSGNDFHWMLYGDKTVEEQVELLLQADAHSVDAGSCNGKLFLNGVGIGFDGAIVRDLLGKKKLAGKASYLLSILKHIAAYHEKSCRLQMPSEIISQDCFMISVANARRYGGGFHVAPKASLTDQLLDINIVGKISALKRIRYLPVIEKGEHLGLDFIQYRQVNTVSISSPAPLHAHVDGEYICADRFDIQVLPKRFSFVY
jgi:YegS/Rv2252/BmrU family lipid kinase